MSWCCGVVTGVKEGVKEGVVAGVAEGVKKESPWCGVVVWQWCGGAYSFSAYDCMTYDCMTVWLYDI